MATQDAEHQKKKRKKLQGNEHISHLSMIGKKTDITNKYPAYHVSASGKVLIVGGYLILDNNYTGLVLSVSARFHTTISVQNASIHQLLPLSPSPSLSSSHSPLLSSLKTNIIVVSPQRSSKPTQYHLDIFTDYDKHFFLTHLSPHAEKNKFVEFSLKYGLMIVSSLMDDEMFRSRFSQGIYLHLQGDDQFYCSVDPLQKNQINKSKDQKTGLGSSASLVSSLVCAIFAHFGLLSLLEDNQIFDHEKNEMLRIAHNVSQFIHCLAQGKVGSGFDVACAFFGSIKYTRFSPNCFTPCLQRETTGNLTKCDLISTLCDNKPQQVPHPIHAMNYKVMPFQLPKSFHLVMGNVKGGSKTSGMVKKVLKWRSECPSQAHELWKNINSKNVEIDSIFHILQKHANQCSHEYKCALHIAQTASPQQWSSWLKPSSSPDISPILHILGNLRENFLAMRSLLKDMGNMSGADIEPDSQTKLLNETMLIPGVVIAGIPGAGGFDAIFTIIIEVDQIKKQSLDSLQTRWEELGVEKMHVQDEKNDNGIKIEQTYVSHNEN